mmetsp:Transcript_115912/g.368580  ORF Transcript_115912/g.368580 Transcript_115912/m.368580 type:complete len:353 (-) Transcript_115912:5-1063(-)
MMARLIWLWATLLTGCARAPDGARQPTEEIVSVKPWVMVVRDFASPEECAKVLKLLERCHSRDWPDCKELQSKLHSSSSRSGKSSKGTVAGKPWRNSTSFQLELNGELDGAVDELVQRAHVIARHPITYGEGVQIASYHEGSYYEFHHDSLSRRATFLLYLTDVPEGDGGETIFPLVRRPGTPEDVPPPLPPAVVGRQRGERLDFKVERMEEMIPYCDSDFYLKIRPEAGKAILFYSYRPDYGMDEFAIHGACPLRRGHKAILQRWMRFEENSLFRNTEDPELKRRRSKLGYERLLQPALVSTTDKPEVTQSLYAPSQASSGSKLRHQAAHNLEATPAPSADLPPDLPRHEM